MSSMEGESHGTETYKVVPWLNVSTLEVMGKDSTTRAVGTLQDLVLDPKIIKDHRSVQACGTCSNDTNEEVLRSFARNATAGRKDWDRGTDRFKRRTIGWNHWNWTGSSRIGWNHWTGYSSDVGM
jgi:hypothetical protein